MDFPLGSITSIRLGFSAPIVISGESNVIKTSFGKSVITELYFGKVEVTLTCAFAAGAIKSKVMVAKQKVDNQIAAALEKRFT